MADIIRTMSDLLNRFRDGQAAGSITPQDMRDVIVTMRARTPIIRVTDPEWGAKADGTTDDFNAIQNAINYACTVGSQGYGGGTVYLPAGTYRVTGGLTMMLNDKTGRCCNLQGDGWASKIVFDPPQDGLAAGPHPSNGFYSCAIIFGTPLNDLRTPGPFIKKLSLYWNSANKHVRWNGIIALTGKHLLIEDVLVNGFPLDGVRAECSYTNGWIESLELHRVQVVGSGQDNFSFVINDGFTDVFITESRMHKCTSRWPGRNAIRFVQANTQGGNYKISNFFVQNCEVDCSGSYSARNTPHLVVIEQRSSNGGNIIENIAFEDCTIEDTQAVHSGYAIGFEGAGTASIGPISVSRCVFYGVAGGPMPLGTAKPMNVTYGAIDWQSNGQLANDFLIPKAKRDTHLTAMLANNATEVIGKSGSAQTLVTAIDGGGNGTIRGAWLVFNTTVVPVFAAVGCALKSAGNLGNLTVQNTSGGSAQLFCAILPLV